MTIEKRVEILGIPVSRITMNNGDSEDWATGGLIDMKVFLVTVLESSPLSDIVRYTEADLPKEKWGTITLRGKDIERIRRGNIFWRTRYLSTTSRP